MTAMFKLTIPVDTLVIGMLLFRRSHLEELNYVSIYQFRLSRLHNEHATVMDILRLANQTPQGILSY